MVCRAGTMGLLSFLNGRQVLSDELFRHGIASGRMILNVYTVFYLSYPTSVQYRDMDVVTKQRNPHSRMYARKDLTEWVMLTSPTLWYLVLNLNQLHGRDLGTHTA